MSQDIFSSIDPAISGDDLATALNSFKNAIVSGFSGTTRPTELDVGGSWVDMTNDPTSWSYRIWTGTDDVEVFTINLSSGVAAVALAVDSFIIKKISADTVGAVMELVKRRIANNGQVLSGDVVGEIRMTGRTLTSTNPVVAKIIWTSTDDQTTTSYGGTLSFMSTPDGTAILTEHFRFINGLFETVVPHKMNSQVLVSQDVATSATIAQLSGAKVLVEMTGSTATDIQGINSGHASKVVTIHNRSTATVTLKHLNAGAAAADQLKLPDSLDFPLSAQRSVTLFYCTTDTLWKIQSTSGKVGAATVDTYYGEFQTWTAPATISAARIKAYRFISGGNTERSGFLDVFGNAFAFGVNASGQLGVGDVTPRSSPVAVLGGFQFMRAWGHYPRDASVTGLTTNGQAYAWGLNTNGQLGTGTVTPVSSPVAVLRGLQFSKLVATSGANTSSAVAGITPAGVAYAWGLNTNGNLGLGDVVPRSSPVAVLGGLTFSDIQGGASTSRYFFVALNTSGAAFAWGANTQSNLGVGDQTPRSSPVAVLGSLTFSRLITHQKSETVMGVTTGGLLYAWGDNTQGVVGDGTIVNKSSPVAVLGGLTFKKVRLFKSTAMGITVDGTLYAWGANANGQLGVGDVTSRSSPVAVLGGLKFMDVFFADGPTDSNSVYGVTPDGTVYAWGLNTNGSLGLGDVIPRSSPVAVLGAFAADPREPITETDLTITAGAAYIINLGPGAATFGGTSIGRDIYKVDIEYTP